MDNFLLLAVLVLLLLFSLLSTRKRYQRLRSIEQYQRDLAPGNKVQMTSGIQGIIVSLTETTVDLHIAEGVITTWDRKAVLCEAPDYRMMTRAESDASISEIPQSSNTESSTDSE